MSSVTPINAVVTSFRVLEHLASSKQAVGGSEIARRMNTGRALVFRHLKTLEELGYVQKDAQSDKYRISQKILSLTQNLVEDQSFLDIVRGLIPILSNRVGFTVGAGMLEPDGIRVVDIVRYRSKIEISTPIGSLFDYETSAQGRVAKAFSSDLHNSEFEAQAQAIRRQGWAISSDEILLGISAIAAPVFNHEGAVAGTLSIVGASHQIGREPDPKIINELLGTARRASQALGCETETQNYGRL